MADDKEKKLHIPKSPEKEEKEVDITKKGKKEIIETLGGTIKSDDENFIPIYGERPERAEVIKILKKRSPEAYGKAETREEIMKILEKNNPNLFHRLQRKEGKHSPLPEKDKIPNDETEKKIRDKKRQENPANDKEVDKYLEEKGYSAPKDKEKDKKKEIKEKKDELVKEDKKPEERPAAQPEAKEEKKTKEKKEKKPRKRGFHPLFTATRMLSGIGGFMSRAQAKVSATVARPQDLFHRKYWGDMLKNAWRTPKAMLKAVTGTFYKPHREKTQFEDVYKGYNETRGPDAKKHKVIKNIGRGVGKLYGPTAGVFLGSGGFLAGVTLGLAPFAKFTANIVRGFNHLVHETFEGVRDTKWHRNPKHWNLRFKQFKYSKTGEAFKRAFSRNKKPEVMVSDSKPILKMDSEKKEAA